MRDKILCIVRFMSKRNTGLGKKKKSHSKKTQKRLAIKREMLAEKARKHAKEVVIYFLEWFFFVSLGNKKARRIFLAFVLLVHLINGISSALESPDTSCDRQ